MTHRTAPDSCAECPYQTPCDYSEAWIHCPYLGDILYDEIQINRHCPYKKGGLTRTKDFWRAAGIRAIRTVAQAAIAAIGGCLTLGEVNWITVASTGALAGVLSILTSIATGLPEADAEVDAEAK